MFNIVWFDIKKSHWPLTYFYSFLFFFSFTFISLVENEYCQGFVLVRVLGQFPPRKIAFRIIVSRIIAPWIIALQLIAPGQMPPRIITPKENYPGQFPPRNVALEENYPQENCSLIIKFPPKIVAPTQPTSPQRVLQLKWGKLYTVSDYYN